MTLVDAADAGAFLARLTRLDRAALVRLRPGPLDPAGSPRVALWARLPWGVLVTRTVRGEVPADVTVGAADLLARLTGGSAEVPRRRDAEWRWPVPADAGRAVETVAAAELRRVAAAAAGTLREVAAGGAGGRSAGERAVRDALLDHVAIVVVADGGERIEIAQRLVQAIVRMGFLGGATPAVDAAQVRLAGRWVGIAARYGTAWAQPAVQLTVRPIADYTNG